MKRLNNLLLLHGALGSKAQFDKLSLQLQNNYEVYSLSFTGHGENSSDERNFSIALFAQDVLDFIEKNKLNTVNIFGYSMGGFVALYLARHYPDKVAKVFTLGTKFNWTIQTAQKETAMLNTKIMEQKIPGFVKFLEDKHGKAQWKNVVEKTAAMLSELGKQSPLSDTDFGEIKSKVALCIGDKDTMVTEEETVRVAELIHQSHYFQLKNTQHAFEKIDLNLLSNTLFAFFKS